ncbi:hypothetical protein FRB99_002024 [Tulasnella sp. 403]|nr:hypothetical protein FRB99_002024 [Tulasnella sp. 403]
MAYVFKRGGLVTIFRLFLMRLTCIHPSRRATLHHRRKERVAFDKITARVAKLCYGLDPEYVEPIELVYHLYVFWLSSYAVLLRITKKVIAGVYPGVTTVELDNLAAETAAYLTTRHPDYAILAARIAISNLHKETKKSFSQVMSDLYTYVNPKNGRPAGMISDKVYKIIQANADLLDSAIIYDRDFHYNYFGFKTLERSYLLRINNRVAERPQHMLMRVAVGIHGEDIDRVIETYNLMSERFFTHASPTLFNAGTNHPQLSSCFLVTMKDDSIEAPGLHEVHSEEFERLFTQYEKEGRAKKVVKAQKLWYAILDAQIETGGPFMLYKDAANRKSNQQNLGTIKSSNLCTEIIEYSSPDEVAVCNLASIALPSFITGTTDKKYDFQKLHDVTKVVAFNLNRIIDVNYYPVPEARRSNMRHRPIGIGVQGLADAFMSLKMPFESPEARLLNKQIFETIYHASLEASSDIAAVDGPYETYEGSPASRGQLQYDLWNVTPTDLWDWDALKKKITTTGLRNSLLLAPMPTASTSQILGFNECFEAYTRQVRPLHYLDPETDHLCLATFIPAESLQESSRLFAHGC